MSAPIVARSEASFTVQVEIPDRPSRLDFEQTIQERLNQAGVVATQDAVPRFDTDGSSRVVGSVQFTSNGQLPPDDQTPSGVATVARHVSQSPPGGTTSCPLDREARLVVSSPPRFAQMIAPKDAAFGVGRVRLEGVPGAPEAVPIVDFSHAAASLSDAAAVRCAGRPAARERWLEDRCQRLKPESGAAGAILKELKPRSTVSRTAQGPAEVEEAIRYFRTPNQKGRLDDAAWVEEDLLIGSGVTEAACKGLVKQRLCGSGMNWKEPGAAAV